MARSPWRRPSREATLRIIWPIVLLAAVVALWQAAAANSWLGEFIVPEPWDAVQAFFSLLSDGVVLADLKATLLEAAGGFVIGTSLGVAFALGAGLSTTFRQMVYPYMIALWVTPGVAIAPIIVAWLGFGYTPKIALVALIIFFPVFINTLTGLLRADEETEEMFRSLGATRLQTFMQLRVPNALPFFFAGLKLAVTLSLIGAIVAEFVSADQGLGVLILQFSSALDMADAYAILFMLTLLGMIFFAAAEYLSRFVLYWTNDQRMAARTRRRMAKDQRTHPALNRSTGVRGDTDRMPGTEAADPRAGTGG